MSIVIESDSEGALTFPEEFVSVTVTLQTPSAKFPRVHARVTSFSATVQATESEPKVAVTVALPINDPDTVMVGVLLLVMLSVLDIPKSELAARSGADCGGVTVVLLITTLVNAVLTSELTPPPD